MWEPTTFWVACLSAMSLSTARGSRQGGVNESELAGRLPPATSDARTAAA